jgi:serine/threonine protein phosphatase PrpC
VSLALRYAARSDVGLLRDGNEDSMYAGPRLLAVADGMGGHAAGEVASAVAIATIAPLDDDPPGADLITALKDAVETANEQLRQMVEADGALDGMGTTLTALLWAGQRLGLVHIGDSRAYLLRDGTLSQITHDHTLVQNLLDEGRITAEEASTHPQRSWITKALDGRGEVELDLSIREVRGGDRYLLCTDGLSGVVSEDTMRESLELPDPKEACDRLVELALRGGGPDNVTVIVADVVSDTDGGEEPIVGGAAAAQATGAPSPETSAGRAALIQPRPPAADEDAADDDAVDPATGGRRWPLIVGVIAVVVLLAGVAAAWAYIRAQWYVGDDSGRIAVYRGVNGSVVGVELASVDRRTLLPVSALPDFEANRVHEGISADSSAAATRIVDRLRDIICTPTATPTPTPAPRATPRASTTPRSTTIASPAPSASRSPGATASPSPSPAAAIPGCEQSP